MGNSASTAFQTGYSLGTQQIEGQPSPLAAALGAPSPTPARSGRGPADDSDEPPALVDAGSDDSAVDVPSEVLRKCLILPTTTAHHVGRLTATPGADRAEAKRIVWEVPKAALVPASPSGTPEPASQGAHAGAAAPHPSGLLLSPTFILPCGVGVEGDRQLGLQDGHFGGHDGTHEVAGTPELACTEWQLVLVPHLVPSPTPSSPPPTNGPDTPPQGSSHPTALSSEGALTQGAQQESLAAAGDSDKTLQQVWKPSLRFLWSPACSAAAQQSSKQGDSAVGRSSSSSDHGNASTDSFFLEPASGSSNKVEGDYVSGSAAGVIRQAERKLLPSAWSIRKKNLAPASYRAAYQAQQGQQQCAEAAALAPHVASTAAQESDLSSGHSTVQLGSSSVVPQSVPCSGSDTGSSSAWQLQCSGRLGVGLGSAEEGDAALTASSGFSLQLDKFGSLWGAPFCICSGGSSNPGSFSVLPAGATAASSAGASQHTSPSSSSTVRVQVDFSAVQLLLTGAATTASAAADRAFGTDKDGTHSAQPFTNSSSEAHQQHPLGQSPPHTPTKDSSAKAQGGSTGQQSSSQAASGGAQDQQGAAAGVLARPVAARHLEAVLLSHSPRMLIIDNFFSPELCTSLMELARDRLVRSRVASGSETPSRTSWGHFFVKDSARHPLILEAEAQIEALFNSAAVRGGYGPLAKVEALQVVRYHKGEFYHEHYDNRADGPLTRAATILVYLCDTEEGGATSFSRAQHGFGRSPEADARVLPPQVSVGRGGRGIKIFPVQGRALVFWSKRPNGDEDPNSIHAAETVLEGEKWIATRWMKDDF